MESDFGTDLATKSRYSYSRLERFIKCPGSYRDHYILNKRTGLISIEAFRGKCVHSALDYLYTEQITSDNLPGLSEVKHAYSSAWDSSYDPSKVFISAREEVPPIEYFFDIGMQCVKDYYLKHYPFQEDKTISTEKLIKFELNGYTIIGYIDREAMSGDKLIIHDYKTNSDIPTEAEIATTHQLSAYELSYRIGQNKFDGDIELHWHFLRHNKSVVATRDAERLEDAKEFILNTINNIEEAIENNHLPYKTNFLCDWCEYHRICPAYKEMKYGK